MSGVNVRHTPYFDPENAFTIDQLAFLVALANEAGNDPDAVPLVSTGTAAPTTTPSVVGDIFVDATNNKVYVATGTASSSDWTEVTGGGGGGGSGDVVGPASATDNAIPRYDGTTGKLIKDSPNFTNDGSLLTHTNPSTAAYLRVQGASDGDNYGALELWNSDGTSKWQFAHQADGDFGFFHNNGTNWRNPFTIDANRDVQIGIEQANGSLYNFRQDADGLFEIQRQGGASLGSEDAWTLVEIKSPDNPASGDREATLALTRDLGAGNIEFLDLYNNGYATETQYGIRIQKRGTGAYRDFVLDTFDGVTKTDIIRWVASTNKLDSNVDIEVPDEAYNATNWNGSLEVPTKNAVRDELENKSNVGHTHTSSNITDFNEAAQDAIGLMVDTSLVYNDATPLLSRAALTGAITASAGSNTTALGSFTVAQLNAAISDADVATGGGTATGTNTGDVTVTDTDDIDHTITGQALSSVLRSSSITAKTTVTPVSGDFILISDTSDAGNLKKVDASNFLGGGGGGITEAQARAIARRYALALG